MTQLQQKLLACANHFTSLYINSLTCKLKILNNIVSQIKSLPFLGKMFLFIFQTEFFFLSPLGLKWGMKEKDE